MADISKIRVPTGTYTFKDAEARQQVLSFSNLTLNLTTAVSDATFSDYPYAVKLLLAGVTSAHVPNIYLKESSSLISDVCETGDGYIKFFAATNTGTITINSITCLKGGNL